MKLTITTLVIIEDTSDNCNELNLCYHSFQEDPNRAKSEIIAAVNGVYAPDRVFNTIEEIYQAHKHTHPTNKIRYIISQLIILTLYTPSLILVSYTYRIILRYIYYEITNPTHRNDLTSNPK